jgi:hypothetical protein
MRKNEKYNREFLHSYFRQGIYTAAYVPLVTSPDVLCVPGTIQRPTERGPTFPKNPCYVSIKG